MNLNKTFKNKKRAFTLAEVVIVMGILGIMMAAFAPVVTKKTLAVGANSFRNFSVADGNVGLAYGTTNDSKTVVIGDQEISNTASYSPKLLIMNRSANAGTATNPQLAFATYDPTGTGTRNYHGQLLMDNQSNLILGGALNANIDMTNQTSLTSIGMNSCNSISSSDASPITNVICFGANSGSPNGIAYQSNRIYLGDKTYSYGTEEIYLGSSTFKQMVEDVASEENWFATPSDIRLKNIGKEFTGGLNEINQLEFYNYTYKRDVDKDPKVGVMAQDLQKVFPNAVKENKDGYLYIRKDEMFYAALNAIKELFQNFTTNEEKIKALEERNAMLEKQNKELQNLYIELSKRVDAIDKKKTKGKLTITPEKEVEEEVIDPEFTLKSESTETTEE